MAQPSNIRGRCSSTFRRYERTMMDEPSEATDRKDRNYNELKKSKPQVSKQGI